MTTKLYYLDPNIYEWETAVTGIEKVGDLWKVKLQETAFYPEGGGQPYDLGTIAGIEVVNVQHEEDEIIHYLIDKPKGEKVFCQIDRMRRLDFTQHHSGQHLLSAVILELYHAPTVSFHLSTESATIDIEAESLTDEQLRIIEEKVNQLILENHNVNIFSINHTEVAKYPLRKVPSGHERLRIVQIEGVEYNACGGTHVNSTRDIGMMKLLKQEKNRKNTRLYFICGTRLFKDYSNKLELLQTLVNKLGTSQQYIIEHSDKLVLENKELLRKNQLLFNEYSEILSERLISENNQIVSFFSEEFTIKELTVISRILLDKGARIVILASGSEQKLLLTHTGTEAVHCGNLIKEIAPSFNGKGGGNQTKAQAAFQDKQELCQFYEHLKHQLQN